MTLPLVLSPAPNTVFLTPNGLVLGTGENTPRGKFRLLKDHFVDGEYIPAGSIRNLPSPWVPTADVEPMDADAVATFYAIGPRLGGCIRTQFAGCYIGFPITFWTPAGPNTWKLTGLGANLPPVVGTVSNIEDKGP